MKTETRVSIPLSETDLLRIMSALAQKPNRELSDELLYERLEFFANQLRRQKLTADYNELDLDEIPF